MFTLISIVIIGRDEGPRVARAVRSARRAMRSANVAGETLFVDSGSRDDSARQAAHEGAKVVRLEREAGGAARARNAGLERARGRWVHFLDADMTMDPSWLRRALDKAEREELDGLTGLVRERLEHASVWCRAFGHDWNASGARTGTIGGAGLWRRSALVSLGGYDETLDVGEDPDLCRRMLAAGHRIERCELEMVQHELGLRGAGDWWHRAQAVGRSAAAITILHGDKRLAWQRFGQPLFALLLLALTALFAPRALPLLAVGFLALVSRRAWLDHRSGLSWSDAWLHGLHVYAVKAPQLIGGLGALSSERPRRAR